MNTQTKLVKKDNSSLDSLLEAKYVKSISKVKKKISSNNKNYKLLPKNSNITANALCILVSSIIPLVLLSIGGLSYLIEGKGNQTGILFVMFGLMSTLLAFPLAHEDIIKSIKSFVNKRLYTPSYNFIVDMPNLASLEKEYIEDKVLLKIVNKNGISIREQFFELEEEIELLETITEWENELIDFVNKNEDTLHNIKKDIILKQEAIEEHKKLLDNHIHSSNQRLLQNN